VFCKKFNRSVLSEGVAMQAIFLRRLAVIVAAFLALSAVLASAQTFTKILDFTSANGADPFHTSLIQGLDGNLYGTTAYGGKISCPPNGGCGTVFGITNDGKISRNFSFDGIDGAYPFGGLVQISNGALFGTTSSGGLNGTGGSVFELTPAGKVLTIYSFCLQTGCVDGDTPTASLLHARDGNFYGVTCQGGLSNDGTVYKISPSGGFTSLHSFNGMGDGSCPYGPLMQTVSGQIYGTTSGGGANQFGTVFTITAGGALKTVYVFAGPPFDGAYPHGGLVQATDGSLYGTTLLGGSCPAAPQAGCGTIYKITATGTFTLSYNFCTNGNPCYDGQSPADGLVLGSDGNLYGTTAFGGGVANAGTIFSITRNGTLTTLHAVNSPVLEGKYPFTTLVQATNGKFYGTMEEGGAKGKGIIFSLDAGLSPFVSIQPSLGKVGTIVSILGNGLTGTTAVSFNGVTAAFKVVSDDLISTTVPAGATTGTVTVNTPGGSLPSNVTFRVLP
jgi:uncharacterized repeat protein (TIGR03803 family)